MIQVRKWKQWLLVIVVLHGIVACAGFLAPYDPAEQDRGRPYIDRKSTRLNSSHVP
jgi:hypothetical protein